jgi:hypothetical protein
MSTVHDRGSATGLTLRAAFRAATPFPISSEIVEHCLGEDELFRRAWADGLDSLPLGERRGRLCLDLGLIAEAVAMLLLLDAGLELFSEAQAFDGHGVDLLALTAAGDVLAVEVKGTLRAGSLPRLGRSRLRQMSIEWLSSPTNPAMVDWDLAGADVYGAVVSIDFARREWRTALTADFLSYAAVRDSSDFETVPSRLASSDPGTKRVPLTSQTQ